MRHIILICILAFLSGLSACKKAESPDPTAEEEIQDETYEYYPDGSLKFLRDIEVPGATNITRSTDSTYYIVDFPASYSQETATIQLALYKGIKKANYTSSIAKDTIIQYDFKGTEPARIELSGESGKKRMIYQVYFRVPGPIKIQLLDNEIAIQNFGAKLPFKVISGLGSLELPTNNDQRSMIKIVEPRSGKEIVNTYLWTLRNVYLQDSLLAFDKLDVQLEFSNREILKFPDVRFVRGIPQIQMVGFDYVKSRKDTIVTYGGYFSKTSHYRAEYSSDFLPTVSSEMKYVNYGNLSNQVPDNIADGSYLISFYEDNKLMGTSSVAVSESNINAIESIWQGDPYDIINNKQFRRPVLRAGDVFYARSSTFIYEYNSQNDAVFNAKSLPVLKIKNNSSTVELTPQVQIISWAVAGVRLMVSKYTLPNQISPGEYTATFIFPDKTESLPYWSKVQIK